MVLTDTDKSTCSFPHSPISFNSYPGYGSFASIISDGQAITYNTDFGEAWVLIPPSNLLGSSSVLSYSCEANSECLANHFLSNGSCSKCPRNSFAEVGSTSISNCKKCPDGTYLSHPLSSNCALSETFHEVQQAKGWRIWAPAAHSTSGWAWAVTNLSFYSDVDCKYFNKISPSGKPIDSANAGEYYYGAANAFGFGASDTWGGRVDQDQAFWLGMIFDTSKSVKCIKVTSKRNHVYELRIQAYNENSNEWENAWIQKSLDVSNGIVTNTIKINYVSNPNLNPTSTPSINIALQTSKPTMSNIPAVTLQPTKSNTPSPTKSPTAAPINLPTAAPITLPTAFPTSAPTNSKIIRAPCEEDSSTLFLLRVTNTGKVVRRSCQYLSKRPTATIKKICKNYNASTPQYDAPKIACPVTCGCDIENANANAPPTKTPTKSPTLVPTMLPTKLPPTEASACTESGSAKYLLKKKNNGKIIKKTCTSLSKMFASKRERICSSDVPYHWKFKSATVTCPVTCGCNKR